MDRKKFKIYLLKCFPLKVNSVVFRSFGGQYNDNPKYISEKLYELRPDIKIIWIITDKSRDKVPDYVEKIPIKGFKFWCRMLISKVIVDNYTGMIWNRSKRNLKFPDLKSKQFLNISTWHGVPLKKIGLEIPGKEEQFYISTSSVLISGNKYAQRIFEKAFYPIPQKIVGYPRNDILVNGVNEEALRRLRKKLGLPTDKKIIVYAPTFRDSVEYSGINQMKALDIDKLRKAFSRRFGGDWCFVFRVHHEVLKKIDTNNITKKYNGYVYDGNLYDDMAEYLAASDALITDYSGSLFDYALTDKPCFLYVPDKDYYVNYERGTYISLDELPYLYAEDTVSLYKIIEEYDFNVAEERKRQFLSLIGNADDGKASENIARMIINHIDNKEEDFLT